MSRQAAGCEYQGSALTTIIPASTETFACHSTCTLPFYEVTIEWTWPASAFLAIFTHIREGGSVGTPRYNFASQLYVRLCARDHNTKVAQALGDGIYSAAARYARSIDLVTAPSIRHSSTHRNLFEISLQVGDNAIVTMVCGR